MQSTSYKIRPIWPRLMKVVLNWLYLVAGGLLAVSITFFKSKCSRKKMVYNMSCKYIKVQPIGPLHMGCITALTLSDPGGGPFCPTLEYIVCQSFLDGRFKTNTR